MEKLIPVINKLQDVFNAVGSDVLDLPQIVVVGSQSSGKSSVLENIVGRDFLPRGTGIVTRRPLVLQLNNLPWEDNGSKDANQSYEEWGEFLHRPGETFYDFQKIKQEISMETDRITGTNKGISSKPINLKIFSPHVLNLTLVDLPGITRVPVGDQPSDIEAQIRKMNLSFIQPKNAIIVAVTAANTDIANSDSLQLAREVDPTGDRTIGVLTKLDIMDRGTNALDILLGQVIPLRLGFVGVVSRNQESIIENIQIRESLKAEQKYFQTHNSYRKIAHRCGTPYLAVSLNKLLLSHIRDSLPELKSKLSTLLSQAETEMASYGETYTASTNKGAMLLSIITKISTDFSASIDGKLTDRSAKELFGGARINYIFNEVFGRYLQEMGALDGLTINDIRTAIRNATGPRTALFVPELSFELLTKRQVARLEEPSVQCVDAVYEELLQILSQLESKELARFSVLRERVNSVVTELLSECRHPTREMIRNLIAIELAYVNSANPDFVGADGAIANIIQKQTDEQVQRQKLEWLKEYDAKKREEERQAAGQSRGGPRSGAPPLPNRPPPSAHQRKEPDSSQTFSRRKKTGPPPDLHNVPLVLKSQGPLSERERTETSLIQSLLKSYFSVIRKNVQDSVPKVIMHFLVNSSKTAIHNRLVERLYREEIYEDLLAEAPEIAQRRKQMHSMVATLKRAKEILNEVRDYNIK